MTDEATHTDPAPVFRLIYRSHDRIPVNDRKAELGTIFSTARSRNQKANITGALLIVGDTFVQTLEGEESAVQALYEHIAVVDGSGVGGRQARHPAPDEREQGGISPAAGRPTTADQDAVLDLMRDAARSETHA